MRGPERVTFVAVYTTLTKHTNGKTNKMSRIARSRMGILRCYFGVAARAVAVPLM